MKGTLIVTTTNSEVLVRPADRCKDAYLIARPFETVNEGKRREIMSVPTAQDVKDYCLKLGLSTLTYVTGHYERPFNLDAFVDKFQMEGAMNPAV